MRQAAAIRVRSIRFDHRKRGQGDHTMPEVITMTTGLFIIARWVLTFGIPLAIAAHQLWLLRQQEEEKNGMVAAPVPAE
jgi:hypothetical protein